MFFLRFQENSDGIVLLESSLSNQHFSPFGRVDLTASSSERSFRGRHLQLQGTLLEATAISTREQISDRTIGKLVATSASEQIRNCWSVS